MSATGCGAARTGADTGVGPRGEARMRPCGGPQSRWCAGSNDPRGCWPGGGSAKPSKGPVQEHGANWVNNWAEWQLLGRGGGDFRHIRHGTWLSGAGNTNGNGSEYLNCNHKCLCDYFESKMHKPSFFPATVAVMDLG